MAVGVNHRRQLTFDDLFGMTRLALCQRFTDTHDRRDANAERALRFGSHHFIGFTMVLAPLRMPHDDIAQAKLLEHGGRNFAGVGTTFMRRDILRTQLNHAARQQGLTLRQIHGRDADRHLAGRLAHPRQQGLQQNFIGSQAAIHLPVTCDQLLFHAFSQVKTIFPTCWLDSIKACALAASAASNTL
ncbi:MAG: triosephosphate isomerase [uncultured bacterium]|nr:MAG: triosephosphate isomerase [uncultured bacterium]